MACAGLGACSDLTCPPIDAQTRAYVVESVRLPKMVGEFSYDLEGDGDRGNHLSSAIILLAEIGLDPESQVNDFLSAHEGIFRVLVPSTSSVDKVNGRVTLSAGMPYPHLGGSFCGSMENGHFKSDAPWKHSTPVELELPLSFSDGDTVHLTAGHLEVRVRGSALEGQLNGAIRENDIQQVLIPVIARALEGTVQSDPQGPLAMVALQNLDTGSNCGLGACEGNGCTAAPACFPGRAPACRNPAPPVGDGACSHGCDGRIDLCEVAEDPLIQNVLGPDAHLFSDDGLTFRPDASHASNVGADSYSVGFAFTARALDERSE